MRELLSWNVSLGQWSGVQVRLHILFVLFAVVAIHFGAVTGLLAYSLMGLAVLAASVLAHEGGHCVAAWRLGSSAEQIVLWPLGGLAHVHISQSPHDELFTSLAGPLVHVFVCAAMAPVLLVGGVESLSLFNPLSPPVPPQGLAAIDALRMIFWVNWLLLVVNMLPAFPLDGGRALRALLWTRCEFRTAVAVVGRAGQVVAVLLCVAAWWVYASFPYASLPLALFGVFLYFGGRQELEKLRDRDPGDAFLGYDFSQGYTSLERREADSPGNPQSPFRRWLDARRAAARERQRQIEDEEERRVDEILARLHESGLDALPPGDRALLDRVSARYRNRQGK